MVRKLALMSLVLLAGAFPARAEYPDRPVKIVAPVGAGGGVDVMARLLARYLSERLGQQFFVENRPGAAGVIGSKHVIASPADGMTLLYAPSSLSLATLVNKLRPTISPKISRQSSTLRSAPMRWWYIRPCPPIRSKSSSLTPRPIQAS